MQKRRVACEDVGRDCDFANVRPLAFPVLVHEGVIFQHADHIFLLIPTCFWSVKFSMLQFSHGLGGTWIDRGDVQRKPFNGRLTSQAPGQKIPKWRLRDPSSTQNLSIKVRRTL